jgi:hypothetical protein
MVCEGNQEDGSLTGDPVGYVEEGSVNGRLSTGAQFRENGEGGSLPGTSRDG